MTLDTPLLTIAIPTWTRASYLALNLAQIKSQLDDAARNKIEVLVSDNASPDDTGSVVAAATDAAMPIRYVRNETNIGSDANIAQCFNLARGKYVLVLGDDDLLIDGALSLLLRHLERHDYGVVVLRPYGYDADFRHEYPGGQGRERIFEKAAEFLIAIGPLMTLISSCIVNKSLLPDVDAQHFCGGSLVQTHLVFLAATRAKENFFLDRYLLACKRNNSGGYDFSTVFVTSMSAVLDRYKGAFLTSEAIAKIERRFLVGYYPYYLLRQRLNRSGDLQSTRTHFERRFRGRLLYDLCIAPILTWPRPLAIVWGAVATLVGRVLNGELRRGVAFFINKFFRKNHRGRSFSGMR